VTHGAEETCEVRGCVICDARKMLTEVDWVVVNYYRFVSDQLVNLAPFGTADDKPLMFLRLTDMTAACELLEVPREDRVRLIELTRFLHLTVIGRDDEGNEMYKLPWSELRPEVDHG